MDETEQMTPQPQMQTAEPVSLCLVESQKAQEDQSEKVRNGVDTRVVNKDL